MANYDNSLYFYTHWYQIKNPMKIFPHREILLTSTHAVQLHTTAADELLTSTQSGISLLSVTIQLFILSLLLRST